ncbi:helix-turn-helix transcriptional regulator [Planctomycetota bacterium]
MQKITDDSDKNLLLNVNQVAAFLNCSPRHVYRMSDAGKLPRPMKLGSLVRWSRESIMAWIQEGCQANRRKG